MKINDNPDFNAFSLSIKNIIKINAKDAKSFIVKESIYRLRNTLGVSNAFITK